MTKQNTAGSNYRQTTRRAAEARGRLENTNSTESHGSCEEAHTLSRTLEQKEERKVQQEGRIPEWVTARGQGSPLA